MWDLPGPGLELSSPALAGGFLTTAPPGKSLRESGSARNLPGFCSFQPSVKRGESLWGQSLGKRDSDKVVLKSEAG